MLKPSTSTTELLASACLPLSAALAAPTRTYTAVPTATTYTGVSLAADGCADPLAPLLLPLRLGHGWRPRGAHDGPHLRLKRPRRVGRRVRRRHPPLRCRQLRPSSGVLFREGVDPVGGSNKGATKNTK